MNQLIASFLVLLTFCFHSALAQSVPPLMNYQGRLTDESGASLPNGTYRLAFRLYTNAVPVASEPLIWGREYDVSIIGGAFNVVLGAAGASPVAETAAVNDLGFAFGNANRYLELQVVRDASNVEIRRSILPRQQLLSSPFSIQAQQSSNSDRLGGQSPSFWVPPGGMMAYGGRTDPSGWLICDGRQVNRADYPALFGAIGTTYGTGNGTTTFNLPDSRGLVLRGTGNSVVRGRTKEGPALGEVQEDQTQRLSGTISWHRMGHPGTSGATETGVFRMDQNGPDKEGAALSGTGNRRILFDSAASPGARTSTRDDGETRVSGLGVNYIIKY